MSLVSLFMRISCKRNDKKRDAGLVQPEDIYVRKDIAYGPHKKHLLDVYRPKNSDKAALPVIVSVHGGGWVYGDKELYSYYCMDLARRGFVVVNFTYRLSPEHKFPCHLEDTAMVFDWLLQNGGDYGMDRKHVFAVGDSAGGHILALYCNLCTNPEFAANYKFKVPEGFVPKAVGLNCGVYDLISAKDSASNTLMLMKDVLGHKGSDAELKAISPAYHVTEGFPPCFVMTCNDDFLKGQAPPLLKALQEKKVPHEYHFYGDDTIKLGHVFHLAIRTEEAIRCNDEQCQYFLKMVE